MNILGRFRLRGRRDEPGSYQGRHYTEYVEEVKRLRRADHNEEAIGLLTELVKATEREGKEKGWGVAPWYYEQLAIIFRMRKDFDEEVAILERYSQRQKAAGVSPEKLAKRLKRARELAKEG